MFETTIGTHFQALKRRYCYFRLIFLISAILVLSMVGNKKYEGEVTSSDMLFTVSTMNMHHPPVQKGLSDAQVYIQTIVTSPLYTRTVC